MLNAQATQATSPTTCRIPLPQFSSRPVRPANARVTRVVRPTSIRSTRSKVRSARGRPRGCHPGDMGLGEIGIWSGELRAVGVQEAADAVAELEALGYGAVWVPGGGGGPILELVAGLLEATRSITVATGILNVWMHDAADVAAARAELEGRHPGRLLLDLGISHAAIVDRDEPGRYARPLDTMRAYLDELDAQQPPVPPEGRVLAALGPKMLQLARSAPAARIPTSCPSTTPRSPAKRWGPDCCSRPSRPSSSARSRGPPPRRRSHGALPRAAQLHEQPPALRLHRRGPADGGSDRLLDAIVAGGGTEAIPRGSRSIAPRAPTTSACRSWAPSRGTCRGRSGARLPGRCSAPARPRADRRSPRDARPGRVGAMSALTPAALLVAAVAALAVAAPAAGAAPTPFGHACTPQDGVRFCPTTDLASRVPSFDGTPLDVDVTLPGHRRRAVPDAPAAARPGRDEDLLRGPRRRPPLQQRPLRAARLRGGDADRARVRRLVRRARLAHRRLRAGVGAPRRHALRGPRRPDARRQARRRRRRRPARDRLDRHLLRRRRLDDARLPAQPHPHRRTAATRRGAARRARRSR